MSLITRVASLALLASLAAGSVSAKTAIPAEQPKRIQVAFVLDTTGSMAALIEGSKRKIWSIANNLKGLEPSPEIEFALIGYRDKGDAYVTKTYQMTDDLQDIYGKLIAFKAGGGGDTPESVNQALREAIYDIDWSNEDDVFRVAFLVGDAPPHMDYQEDQYPAIIRHARKKDIVVNAIQAGSMRSTTPIWKEIASLGGGDFARIEQSGGMQVVETPFDDEIQQKNIELNKTVIPYGDRAQKRIVREKTSRAYEAAPSVASDMAAYISKSSRASKVVTGTGDLTEQIMSGDLEIDALSEEALPDDLQKLSQTDRNTFIEGNIAKRKAVQTDLEDLVAQRDAWIAKQRAEANAPADSFDLKVERMIEKQAASKGFATK